MLTIPVHTYTQTHRRANRWTNEWTDNLMINPLECGGRMFLEWDDRCELMAELPATHRPLPLYSCHAHRFHTYTHTHIHIYIFTYLLRLKKFPCRKLLRKFRSSIYKEKRRKEGVKRWCHCQRKRLNEGGRWEGLDPVDHCESLLQVLFNCYSSSYVFSALTEEKGFRQWKPLQCRRYSTLFQI